jgi:hypothetical protein
MYTILLLIASNVFMTFAWYGHLKTLNNQPLMIAILVSWGIAFLNTCSRFLQIAWVIRYLL